MGKGKRKGVNQNQNKKGSDTFSFDSADEQIAKIQLEKGIKLDAYLKSNDVGDLIKAQNYLNSLDAGKQKVDPKAFYWMPDDYGSGNGTKETYKVASFETLQRMGDIFIIKDIVNTRSEQIQRFLNFTIDDQKEGYTIRKRVDILDVEPGNSKKSAEGDKNVIKKIRDYLENGGFGTKWEDTDDLGDFIRKITRDSLSMDQVGFECIRNRRGELVKHKVLDGSTIRILDSQDPKFKESWKNSMQKGYYPKYGQVWSGNIVKNPETNQPVVFYPWELGYGVRNKNSNIRSNGYGVSETESLMEIITWILWGMQYNGNFFKNGSQPKGFVNIKQDGGGNTNTISEFKNNWIQMMTGVQNAHKTPVFQGIDLEWINMQESNKDMEFHGWLEFLLVVACSVYTIDPSELGFNFKNQAQMFGQDGQKQRLDHSKKKGLIPLLRFQEKLINKYLVSELHEDYEFAFTGLDVEDELSKTELVDAELKAGIISMEDAFKKKNGRDYDPEKDTILNPIMFQYYNAKMQGGDAMNQVADGNMEGMEDKTVSNAFDEFGKSDTLGNLTKEDNPYGKLLNGYINKTFNG
jgi:hypothetical protein